jgi:hypothetical protein
MRRNFNIIFFCLMTVMSGFSQPAEVARSGDAWVAYEKSTNTWKLGTKQMTQALCFFEGNYCLKEFKNSFTGTDYIGTAISDEFRFVMDNQLYSGSRGNYELVSYNAGILPIPKASPGIDPGVFLEITLRNPKFSIRFNYQVYASSPWTPMGMVRKYYTVTNITSEKEELSEISMNVVDIDYKIAKGLRLHYWQGGGSWKNTNHEFVDSLQWASHTFHSDAGANDYRVDNNFSGSSSYHPYFVLQHDSGEGMFFGFNYLGPWSMKFWSDYRFPPDQEVKSWGLLVNYRRYFYVNSQLEQHRQTLKPGESFESPNSFTGIYKGDMDYASEQLQYWQAAYKWDYTRERYLYGGTMWNAKWIDKASMNNTSLHFQQVFDMVNKCRQLGFNITHEDDFWFDDRGRGVWEGVDWKQIVDYARKSGINFKLWMPPNHFARNTPNDSNHKEWHLDPKTPAGVTLWYGYGYCPGSNDAVGYMKDFLLERQKRYGTYMNRFDGWMEAPCYSDKHNHQPGQPFVVQYRNGLRLLKELKVADPDIGIEGCNSGGEWADWDKTEFLESQQESDGGGEDDFYHLSYFWCIPKMVNISSSSDIEEKDMQKERERMLMQKYLHEEKVIDRFMNLYHPKAEGAATPHCFIQLTNADRSKCVIRQDEAKKNQVVVFPKSLKPNLTYSVRFRYGGDGYSRSGAELMQAGITFKDTTASQMIFLNLDDFPGSGKDKINPSAPKISSVKKTVYCGKEGIEINWTESKDDRLLAGYEVYRDGHPIDFVGIGTFYFDYTAGNTPKAKYRVVAVDGHGNKSEKKQ